MIEKINTQEVKVNRIRIDYIKPGHEEVQLLIEYYNAILTAYTPKIYTKSTSLVSHRPHSILLLQFWVSTQCLEWRHEVFIYRNFWAVLNPTFGAQPQWVFLHRWVSFSTHPLVLVLSTRPFPIGRVFLAVEPYEIVLQVSLQERFPHEVQLHLLC